MKKNQNQLGSKAGFGAKLLIVSLILLFIAVIPAFSQPKLGKADAAQKELNAMPAVPLLGNNLKLEFGGDVWNAKNNGKNFLAGSYKSIETEEGFTVLVLKQTHTFVRIWVPTPGPTIYLKYTPKGDVLPATLLPMTQEEAAKFDETVTADAS